MNKIVYRPKAAKQLRKIPEQQQIRAKIKGLAAMPNCTGVKALSNHIHQYRLRVGNYRVFFNFDGTVHIVSIEEVKKRDENTY
ncbi:type II toxin-antitoxin system RelE family toxin [Neisseria sp. WLZKY-1]|jgi:hypothetical protein|uniref:type II toxin-antitoxin system RelE family toxin n=1 Tax=Neisseria TaxID=482 RepID=UPI002852E141|nr:type II toxin-antitoxin system RelE/ParE family toxin [Neisseria elongata]